MLVCGMMYRVLMLMLMSNVPMVHCVLMLLCSFASYLITQAVSGSVLGARMRKTAVMTMKRAAWRRGSEGVSSLAANLPFRTEVFSREHWKCIHWMYTGSVYTGCVLEVRGGSKKKNPFGLHCSKSAEGIRARAGTRRRASFSGVRASVHA
jgi:hypothetical protein